MIGSVRARIDARRMASGTHIIACGAGVGMARVPRARPARHAVVLRFAPAAHRACLRVFRVVQARPRSPRMTGCYRFVTDRTGTLVRRVIVGRPGPEAVVGCFLITAAGCRAGLGVLAVADARPVGRIGMRLRKAGGAYEACRRVPAASAARITVGTV